MGHPGRIAARRRPSSSASPGLRVAGLPFRSLAWDPGGPLDVWKDDTYLEGRVFGVHKGGARIGDVTSACYSPRLEKNIGFAMVPTEHSELGTEL